MGNCNLYNFRQYNFNIDNAPYIDWINSAETKAMFGVPTDWKFASSNYDVYFGFYKDIMQTKVASVVYLLDNIKVMLYNG